MPGLVLLETVKLEHAERIRKAERDRLFMAAVRAGKRPPVRKSLLLMLARS